jgi:hypothetical protein
MVKGAEILVTFNRTELGACVGLFIAGDQISYYNAINVPNYLLHQ